MLLEEFHEKYIGIIDQISYKNKFISPDDSIFEEIPTKFVRNNKCFQMILHDTGYFNNLHLKITGDHDFLNKNINFTCGYISLGEQLKFLKKNFDKNTNLLPLELLNKTGVLEYLNIRV
jgi:hypothetical protein